MYVYMYIYIFSLTLFAFSLTNSYSVSSRLTSYHPVIYIPRDDIEFGPHCIKYARIWVFTDPYSPV